MFFGLASGIGTFLGVLRSHIPHESYFARFYLRLLALGST
jgi:hypothetical protein